MQYDFTLAANAAQVRDIKGRFFKYKSGLGSIRVKLSTGQYVDLLPGQGVWNVDYSMLTIEDRSGAGNSGVLLAGDFDFHDDRIAGDVSVIDGGKSRTLSNMAFSGSLGVFPAAASSAGTYPSMQLWNPTGSGVVTVIESFMVSSSVANAAFFFFNQTALASGTSGVLSKLSGGALSKSIAKYGESATRNATAVSFGGTQLVQNQSVIFSFKEPVILSSGYGFVIEATGTATYIQGNIEFYEMAV